MSEFLIYCDFQSAFSFLAFFSGMLSLIAFGLADSGRYEAYTPAILRFAKIFLILLLVSVFFLAALPSKEEMSQILLQ